MFTDNIKICDENNGSFVAFKCNHFFFLFFRLVKNRNVVLFTN